MWYNLRLVKIEDGLLEQDNFFLTSPFSHFVGNFNGRREQGGTKFELYSGFIERKFEYEQYVVVVKKSGANLEVGDNRLAMYIRHDQNRAGIMETRLQGNGSYKYWKLMRYHGFTQGYASHDGKDWNHLGGGDTPPTSIQGFEVQGDVGFDILDYKVYKSPYVTLYGFPEHYICNIEDSNGDIISDAIFDSDGKVELLLEHIISGKLNIIDNLSSAIVYTSDIIDLKFGDVYSLTEYEGLDLIYKGVVLDFKPTLLNMRKEVVVIKNNSTNTYSNIGITPILPNQHNTDVIEVSFDGVTFHPFVNLETIAPNEEVDLYISITKDRSISSYGTRHFVLELD